MPDHRPICVRKRASTGWYWHCFTCVGGDWGHTWLRTVRAASAHAAYHQCVGWAPDA